MASKRSFLKSFFLFLGISCLLTLILGIIFTAASKKEQYGKPKIAIVRVDGVILSSKKIISLMEKYNKNPTVKGIVLRVDSVGGGVAPSQEIHEEVKKIQKSGKKVVVSMGSVAASGGYYIACGADKIVANPGTMTGSIGVIMEFPNFQELMKVVGMKSSVIKSGKYKDIGSPARKMTSDEKNLLQGVIDNVYEQFVSAISEGRHLKKSEVRSLADGRIFSGERAKELKLVDELGGLQKAVEEAAKMCNVKDYDILEEKESTTLSALLSEALSGTAKHFNLINPGFAGFEYRWSP